MLCKSGQRGARTIPCTPLGRTGAVGERDREAISGHHTGRVFQSCVLLGDESGCRCHFSLTETDQRWEKGSRQEAFAIVWKVG